MAEGTLRGYSRRLDGYDRCLYSLHKDSPRPHRRTSQDFKSCEHAGNSLIILALLSLTSDHYPIMAFVKGDTRINRKGRPKGFDPVRLLAQRIAEEPAGEGDPRMTILEGILRRWATDPKLQPAFVECAYGKAPPAHTAFKLPEEGTLTEKGDAVLSAIGNGGLSPEQGAKLLQ